jgi:iron complex outermembrane receptor protein
MSFCGSRCRPARLGSVLAVLALVVWVSPARAGPAGGDDAPGVALTDLSLEQLMSVEVTTVSRKGEALLGASSAVYVITGEDIRRSGLTSIPEALRMAPGVDVARVNGSTWAISVRGFNEQFATKLLVLIDGRTVYTSLFSGVFWDVQDVLLEDVDRIEVIRGPGAALWGANAVNGVINIITKDAARTQGALVTAGGGTEERGFGAVRYGGALGAHTHYRLWAKYFDRAAQGDLGGLAAHDGWDVGRGGFRIDWKPSERQSATFLGAIYQGGTDQTTRKAILEPPFALVEETRTHLAGGHLLGRWHRHLANESELTVQVYYDRTERDAADVRDKMDVADLDVQHRVALGRAHDVVWGLGYRFTHDRLLPTFFVSADPGERTYSLVTGFVQDEITLLPERLRLTLGTKLEHNDFTGFEVQPSVRMSWTPSTRHALWASVSRAVRTPSRADDDVRINSATFPTETGLPAELVFLGNRGLTSEKVVACELGYRTQPWTRVSLDVATFYNEYSDLRSAEPVGQEVVSDPVPHLKIVNRLGDRGHGHSYGAEAALAWSPRPWWRLAATGTFLELELHPDPGITPPDESKATEGGSPKYQASVRSYLNLPRDFELDASLYYVDALSAEDAPSYVRLDLRLGWQPTETLEISVAGQNLLENDHIEFALPQGTSAPTQVERGVYGRLTLRF